MSRENVESTYFDGQHHDGQSSGRVNIRLQVVNHGRVTALKQTPSSSSVMELYLSYAGWFILL